MSLTDTERNQRRAQQQGKLPGGGGGEEGELSRPVRYVMSCAIANALYFGLYWLLVPVVARSSVAVAGAYAVSVVWRHALHRRLVYGRGLRVDAGYVGELLQLYAAYSASLLLNPLIAEAVTLAASLLWSPAHPPHGARARARWLKGVGFGAAMAATAALNYLVVRRVLAPPAPHGPAPKPRPRP